MQEEDHRLQYHGQKVELQMDHRLQSNADLEDSNILGIDTSRRSHHESIHELDIDSERNKGTRDNITYEDCQKNQLVDGCREFLSSGS